MRGTMSFVAAIPNLFKREVSCMQYQTINATHKKIREHTVYFEPSPAASSFGDNTHCST
jgi:hypothetical protein